MVFNTSINSQDIQESGTVDPDLIHTVDKKGNPFAYHIRDLCPDRESYEYMKRQKKSFEEYLPELIQKYAGRYILFEDGLVIDSDEDEDVLLDRVWETDFINERMGANGHGIYCHLVPHSLK